MPEEHSFLRAMMEVSIAENAAKAKPKEIVKFRASPNFLKNCGAPLKTTILEGWVRERNDNKLFVTGEFKGKPFAVWIMNAQIEESEQKPYIIQERIVVDRLYNPNYGDDRVCQCGHAYYRHFDSYDDMYPCGCKHCGCNEFVQFKEKLNL